MINFTYIDVQTSTALPYVSILNFPKTYTFVIALNCFARQLYFKSILNQILVSGIKKSINFLLFPLDVLPYDMEMNCILLFHSDLEIGWVLLFHSVLEINCVPLYIFYFILQFDL